MTETKASPAHAARPGDLMLPADGGYSLLNPGGHRTALTGAWIVVELDRASGRTRPLCALPLEYSSEQAVQHVAGLNGNRGADKPTLGGMWMPFADPA